MNPIYGVFVFIVWILSTYFIVLLILILATKKKELNDYPDIEEYPKVSIVVPAYNEGAHIAESMESLRNLDYPKNKLEVIVISDGSTDNTAKIARQHAGGVIKFINNKENKGKAHVLNQGIKLATGEFVATMDADSMLDEDILKKTVPYFKNKKTGAVTVRVEVARPKSILQKIVEIEYVIGLSLVLKALSFFDAMYVTPGPFSIYRKSLMQKMGGFDPKNITEDMEIAYRIHKSGYKIQCCLGTKVETITPGTLKELYKQRKRWYTGSLMTIKQHKDVVFNPKIGLFGFAYPLMLLLTTLGLGVFGYSLYLLISNLVNNLGFYSLTNYNVLSYLRLSEIDPLAMGTLMILGFVAVGLTAVSSAIFLKMADKKVRTRIPGFVGFIFFFVLYQVFWAASYYSALVGRKVKWR